MADGPKIAEAHIDIVADMSTVRADLAKVKDMLKQVQAPAVQATSAFSKLTAVFTGITAGLGVMRVGFGALKSVVSGVAKVISGTLKVAFTILKKVAETVFGVMRRGFNMAVSGVKKFVSITKTAVQTQAEFGQSMARVGALTSTVGTKDFDSLRQKALDLGKATEFSAGEAADAMGNFAMAGFKTNQIMEAVGPTLDFASANQLGLAQSSDIAARVMGAMGIEASRTGDVMDALTIGATKTNQNVVDLGEAFKNAGSSSKAAGVDLEGTTAALMVLADQGQRGSEAGSALKQVFLKMPSKQVTKMFGGLGIAMTDAAGSMRPMPDLLDDLNKAIAGKGEFEKLNMLTEAFGTRAGPGMIKLLNAGGDAWREYAKVVRGATGETKRIADIQRATLATAFKIVKSAADDLRIAIGDVFEPFVQKSAKDMVGALNRIAAFVRSNTDVAQEKIAEFLKWFKANFREGMTQATTAVVLLWDSIITGYERVKAFFATAVQSAGGVFGNLFGLDELPAGASALQKFFHVALVSFIQLIRALTTAANILAQIGKHVHLLGVQVAHLADASLALGGGRNAMARTAVRIATGKFMGDERAGFDHTEIAGMGEQQRLNIEADTSDWMNKTIQANNEMFAKFEDTARHTAEGIVTSILGPTRDAPTKQISEGLKEASKMGDEIAKATADRIASIGAISIRNMQDKPIVVPPAPSAAGAVGTIATVFGQMKVGVTEEVKLLGELVKLNKVIASNTGSQGTLGGILS